MHSKNVLIAVVNSQGKNPTLFASSSCITLPFKSSPRTLSFEPLRDLKVIIIQIEIKPFTLRLSLLESVHGVALSLLIHTKTDEVVV